MADVPNPTGANEYIEQQLHRLLSELETKLDAHALCFNGPLYPGMDGAIRMAVEKRHQTAPEKNRVAVILTTGGGLVEIAQRIAQTFRHFYEKGGIHFLLVGARCSMWGWKKRSKSIPLAV